MLHVGGTVVLFEAFEPDRFLAGLATHGCTVAFAVPTQFTMLLASPRWGEPLTRLRYFISGGAPCPPSVRTAVRDAGYGMRQGYGLTECGPNCFATSDDAADAHANAVGWPVPFLEMRLVREDGTEAAVDEPGELLLRGPQMFAGYFGAPERTREALTPDGWLRTGDLARRDAGGRYTICGRRKEMFISGGENVFPGEVEAALCDIAGVAEAVVVGIGDAKWGEVGHAFVVARSGASLDEAALIAGARARLAGYKVPKRVTFCAELPRLGSGKVDRSALLRFDDGS
jgi:fatty-acyl-CoA synthase